MLTQALERVRTSFVSRTHREGAGGGFVLQPWGCARLLRFQLRPEKVRATGSVPLRVPAGPTQISGGFAGGPSLWKFSRPPQDEVNSKAVRASGVSRQYSLEVTGVGLGGQGFGLLLWGLNFLVLLFLGSRFPSGFGVLKEFFPVFVRDSLFASL